MFLFKSIILLLLMLQNAPTRVKLDAEIAQVYRQQKIVMQGSIYFNPENNFLLTHYKTPIEYYFKYEQDGGTMYYPTRNQAAKAKSDVINTESSLIYYFLTNNTSDMGLKAAGFEMVETKVENNQTITNWKPVGKINSKQKIAGAKLVHENFLPIYIEFTDDKGKPLKKTYYYEYQMLDWFAMPQKVTEIMYLSAKDSVVSRHVFSNIETGNNIYEEFFNFKIPDKVKWVQ